MKYFHLRCKCCWSPITYSVILQHPTLGHNQYFENTIQNTLMLPSYTEITHINSNFVSVHIDLNIIPD
jgi:hypothetical protein